jgi:pimeloyl-ACP methyl ester carboxylesterase
MSVAATAGARVPVRRAYADARFGQLHYRIARPAAAASIVHPPLLCLHMSPNSGRIFQRFLGAMGVDRIAIAPDTPGFGESDAPPAPPTIDDYAAAMGDLVDALGIDQFDVMGYHTGSETSVALALARPRQVRRVVMVSAPVFTDAELVEFRQHYKPVELDPEGAHLVRKWKGQLHWAMPGKTMAMLADDFVDCVRNPQISWWGHYAAFAYDTAGNLAKVTQPVRVLNPDDDLHAHTLRAEGLIRHGRIQHLPGWGHGFLDVHTDEARAIVTGFLDGEPA